MFAIRSATLGPLTATLERRPDGTMLVRSHAALGEYPRRTTDRLAHWAATAPERPMLAWRSGEHFESIAYGGAFAAIQRIGQALVDRDLSAERPVAILSGNDRDHALLSLAAQHVGIPICPISPAYSTSSRDFGVLKHAIGLLTPGLVFVNDAARFAPAIAAAIPGDVEVVAGQVDGSRKEADPLPCPDPLRFTPFDDLLRTTVTPVVARAHDAIQPDAIAKILLTSGSTGAPKGVINTHRMLCSNNAMVAYVLGLRGDDPPVLVDWLPWHHTFGGNHNVGLVIHNGGTLYIDEGRPLPALFGESVRNLREIAPTMYLNVPRGYEELVKAMRRDAALRRNFFSRLRVMFYAAAALSQHILDELNDLAEQTCGERLIMVTGLGATETAPMAICRTWESPLAGAIGLPVPGVEMKLAPTGDKLEARVRGPNVTPGYWRRLDLTRAAFDEEGYYRFGDAVRLLDPGDINAGFAFDGRLAEDFKLATGTWVNVGVMRARLILHLAPLVRDMVITGHDRNDVGMLGVPDLDACRTLCPDLPASAEVRDVLGHPAVHAWLAERLTTFAEAGGGASTRIVRAMLLEEPPSLDALEVTDKGSLNQRAVLARRSALVDELYAEPHAPRVIAVPAC